MPAIALRERLVHLLEPQRLSRTLHSGGVGLALDRVLA
jgi:hypothetical protein